LMSMLPRTPKGAAYSRPTPGRLPPRRASAGSLRSPLGSPSEGRRTAFRAAPTVARLSARECRLSPSDPCPRPVDARSSEIWREVTKTLPSRNIVDL
jgi:hypothetical protein